MGSCLVAKSFTIRCSVWSFTRRSFTSTCNTFSKGRTYDSQPVPGSEDHLNPQAWAERLFKLKELQEVMKLPEEASPVFMICRIKHLKGINFYERAFLEKFGIGSTVKMHKWALVKNTPSVSKELDIIKHIIKIQPITFPDGLPKNNDDFLNFRLLPTGKFLRKGTSPFCPLKSLDLSKFNEMEYSAGITAAPALYQQPNPRYLTRSYLRQWNGKRWARHQLFSEFFTSHYKYKWNQDGQEYRYNKLWRLDDSMRQSLQQRKNADGTYKPRNNSAFDADWNTYPWAFY